MLLEEIIIVAKWFKPKSRAVIKGRGQGIFPSYYERDPAYFCRK